jgi:hypothetical protein
MPEVEPIAPTSPADAAEQKPVIADRVIRAVSLIQVAQGEPVIIHPKKPLCRNDFTFVDGEHIRVDGYYVPRIEFGDLTNREGLSRIILFAYSQDGDGKSDVPTLSYRREIVFLNSMAIDALLVGEAKGNATHLEHSQALTADTRVTADTGINFEISDDFVFTLTSTVPPNSRTAVVAFNQFQGEPQILYFDEGGRFRKPSVELAPPSKA